MNGFTEENIYSDEPHVSMRCEENDFPLEKVKKILLDPNSKLIRIVEDRPKVYKLYYFLSKKRELKVVIDLDSHKLTVRTVKVLSSQFRIKALPRRRF